MSWNDIKTEISKIAPVLGSLFGPIGSAIGSVVSGVLGVDNNPTAIQEAIAKDPEAAQKLLALEAQIITATQNADTSRLQTINTTMQTEIASNKWYDHWRSAWGWLSALAFFGFIGAFAYTIVVNPTSAATLLQYVASVSQLFFVPGVILGVVAWHGGKQQRLLAGESSNGLLGNVAKILSK